MECNVPGENPSRTLEREPTTNSTYMYDAESVVRGNRHSFISPAFQSKKKFYLSIFLVSYGGFVSIVHHFFACYFRGPRYMKLADQ